MVEAVNCLSQCISQCTKEATESIPNPMTDLEGRQ